ncbi:MAG: hypothetical protein HY789_12465 [Deltaproteobacteria bacterium]|nr:hypothetical protein [Deltaproteobacteria bacterium]
MMTAVKSAIRNPQSAIALIRNLLTPHSSLLTSFLLLLLLQGCASSPQTWYKPGGTQREYDLNARECEVLAEQQALLKSETGKRYDPLTYAELYQRCIKAKGWGTEPPPTAQQPETEASPAPALGTRTDNRLSAFGLDFTLPGNARLLSSNKQTIGPTRLETFMFQTGGDFMNIIFQESEEATFNPIDYPVSLPYQLYTSDWGTNLRWSAFWGEIKGEWVKGIGAFFTVSKKQRTIVVITAPMAAPAEAPPENLQLARNQYQEMESFVEQWRPWLVDQAPRESWVKQGLKKAFDVLRSF